MNEGALPELPGGWVWTRLKEICTITDRDHKTPKYIEKGILLISPKSFTLNGIDFNSIKFVGEDELVNFKRKCKPEIGDILYSRIGTIGEARLVDFKNNFVALHSIAMIKPNYGITDSKFILYLLMTPFIKNQAFRDVKSIGTPDLGLEKINNFEIPLPPLPEQRRIVTKLEELFTKLDSGVEALEKMQAQLKRYRQSVLKAACEGKLVSIEAELARAEGRNYESADVLLVRILKERREKLSKGAKYKEPTAPDTSELPELPKGWEWAGIDQVSQRIVDCLHSTPKFILEGKYCIDTNCIEQGKILFEKARFVSEETYNERVSRLVPQADDILFAREGTIGTAVIVPPNIELCLGQRIMMFRAANGVIPSYFMWALQSQIFEKQWESKVSGSTVPHVNIGDILLMALPLPPTSEQRRIVAEVERRLSLADGVEKTVEQSLAQAERLRQSILKRAFEGKLVPQDPADEPAGVLLERIQMERSNWERRGMNKEISTKVG